MACIQGKQHIKQNLLLSKKYGGYILAKLSANGSDLFIQSGRKHHHLLLMWSSHENALHILSHVDFGKHAIAFVQNKMLDFGQVQSLSLDG
jgi:hypothetical protein